MSGIGRAAPGTSTAATGAIGETEDRTQVDLEENVAAPEASVVRGSAPTARGHDLSANLLAQSVSGRHAAVTPGASAPAEGSGPITHVGLDAVSASALDSLRGLAPTKIRAGDPLAYLSAVKDGDVVIEIPMKPGDVKVKGVKVGVPEGAVMRVQVQVRDGKLVPAEDRRGRSTGAGTKVEIHPPLDLPLWLKGNGAYLRDRGDAKAGIYADLGGFFDIRAKELDMDLGALLRDVAGGRSEKGAAGVEGGGSGAGASTGASGGNKAVKSGMPLPEDLFDFGAMKFEGVKVSLKDNVVDAGSLKVDLAPGTYVAMKGDMRKASLQGEVNIDGVSVKQDGLEAKLGKGTMAFEASLELLDGKNLSASTKITKLDAKLEGAAVQRPARPGDPDPDHLTLGQTTITGGAISTSVTLERSPASGKMEVVSTTTDATLTGTGSLGGAKITAKDGRGDATVRLGQAGFTGTVSLKGKDLTVDGRLKDASVEVADLQAAEGTTSFDLERARMQGDATIKLDSGKKQLEVDLDATSIDVKLDDLKTESPDAVVDLGRTEVTGSGKVKIDGKSGISLEGKLTAKVSIDDLKAGRTGGDVGVDLAKGSTLDAELTRLSAGNGKKVSLEGSGKVKAVVEGVTVEAPGVSAKGTATVDARADVKITDGKPLISNVNGKMVVNVDDGLLAPKNASGLSLDLGKGTTITANVKNAVLGPEAKGSRTFEIGPGSVVDAVLDKGEVSVEGRKITLSKGSRARFDVESLEVKDQKKPALRGNLTVDADVKNAGVDLKDLPGVAGIKVDLGQAGSAKAKITLEDVRLGSDGSFSAGDARVNLSGKMAGVTGASTGRISATKGPEGTLSADVVKQKSAAEIAGAAPISATTAVKPLDLVKKIDGGTLNLVVPLEGRIGPGKLASVDFAKGTTIQIDAKVADGQIIPSKTKVSLSQPGDAPAWITVDGAYLEEDGTVRLKLGGMYDFAIPGVGKLPLSVDGLVDKIGAKSGGSSGSSGGTPAAGGPSTSGGRPSFGERMEAQAMSALKLDGARFEVKDLTLEGGKLELPGGVVDLSASGNRLSVKGTAKGAVLEGSVSVDSLKLEQEGLALGTGKGRVDLRVETTLEPGAAKLKTTLSNINLDVEYAVQKRANGDYIQLASGKAQGGKLEIEAKIPLDAKGRPSGKPVANVPGGKLDIPSFSGTIAGGRVTVPQKTGGTAQVELGRTEVKGEVHVDAGKILVKGELKTIDVAVKGFETRGSASGKVDAARIQASGKVEYSSEKGLTLDANVSNVDVRASDIRGGGSGTGRSGGNRAAPPR